MFQLIFNVRTFKSILNSLQFLQLSVNFLTIARGLRSGHFFVKSIFRIFMRLLGGSRQFSYKLDIEYPMLKKIRGQFNIFENLYVTLENLHTAPILKKLRILK